MCKEDDHGKDKAERSIEDKIEKAQQKVIRMKEKYDAAVAELRKLYDKRDAMRKDELMDLFVKSNRFYEEVKEYLQAGISDEEKENRCASAGQKTNRRV